MSQSKFILLGLVLIFITGALGHSYLTNPTSRSNQKKSTTGCRGPNCIGPCDARSNARSNTKAVTIARGAPINLQWPRNNHAGGFIRIAWTLTSQSDNATAFDAGVQQIFCHEVGGCKSDDPRDLNGGDTAPADGSFQPCQKAITVPLHLTDGTWTLQWSWFGAENALGDYYSCVDYTVAGGPTGAQLAPFFTGGDVSYPNQNKCKFFNTDRLHRCVNEPCNNPVYTLGVERSGPAYGFSSVAPAAITTGKITTAATPVSTGRLTTGAPVPKPATTGSRTPPVTTGQIFNTPIPNGNDANCAAATAISPSIASIVAVDTWGTTIRMVVQINVVEDALNNWLLQVVWPTNAVSTRVTGVYNAGTLQCEGTSPTRHAVIGPVAAWANGLHSGAILMIEVVATNTNMNSQFIMANTELRVLTA